MLKLNRPLTEDVTLSTGVTVTVRRLSLQALTFDASQAVLAKSALMQTAAAHAKQGADALLTLPDQTPRRPDFDVNDPTVQLALMRETQRVMLAQGVVKVTGQDAETGEPIEYTTNPTATENAALAALIDAYGGFQHAPDLGLGADFDLLTAAIERLSGDGLTPQEAKRFPRRKSATP